MVKNIILIFISVLFMGAVTYGMNAYFKTEKGDFFVLEKGKAVPDFNFQTLDGRMHNYADYINGPSFIHFWASWCAPCVVEFPELIEFAKLNPAITVLAISSDRNEEAIERFLRLHAPNVPENFLIIHDKQQYLTQDKFGVFALPETFYVRPSGVLESHIIGAYADWPTFSF